MRKLPTDKNGVELMPPQVTPDLNQRRAAGKTIALVTLVRRYQLITPLFGGGVEPGVADPVTLIRGPEIRGHLRFWWRACRGGQFGGSLTRMKEAEDLLWGAASTAEKPRPSKVELSVSVTDSGTRKHPFVVVAGRRDRDGETKTQNSCQRNRCASLCRVPVAANRR